MSPQHYPVHRPLLLRWLPERCWCGVRHCPDMRQQETARHRFADAVGISEEEYQRLRGSDHGGWGRR